MRVAIMQPYFLPYFAYFQLIAAVDLFVIYDNIEYTKRGWINRNRLLRDGKAVTFTVPLQKGSDYLNVNKRQIAPEFHADELVNRFRAAYMKAPEYTRTMEVVEPIVRNPERNLFAFVERSVVDICRHLNVHTVIRRSSSVPIDHGLKGQSKVLAICEALGARTYVNAVGGRDLYSVHAFADRGVSLKFLHSAPFVYSQFNGPFIPNLSIVDGLMFNPLSDIRTVIGSHYDLV